MAQLTQIQTMVLELISAQVIGDLNADGIPPDMINRQLVATFLPQKIDEQIANHTAVLNEARAMLAKAITQEMKDALQSYIIPSRQKRIADLQVIKANLP